MDDGKLVVLITRPNCRAEDSSDLSKRRSVTPTRRGEIVLATQPNDIDGNGDGRREQPSLPPPLSTNWPRSVRFPFNRPSRRNRPCLIGRTRIGPFADLLRRFSCARDTRVQFLAGIIPRDYGATGIGGSASPFVRRQSRLTGFRFSSAGRRLISWETDLSAARDHEDR